MNKSKKYLGHKEIPSEPIFVKVKETVRSIFDTVTDNAGKVFEVEYIQNGTYKLKGVEGKYFLEKDIIFLSISKAA